MITYSEIMKYHNKLGLIWKLPTIPHESVILINELNPKDRVLDLGCGNGWVYHDVLLPAGYDGEYVGYDDDKSLIAKDFKLYHDWDELVRNEERFDVVIIFNLLEHLDFEHVINWLEFISKNLMKKKSKMLILTPNVFCFDYLFKDPQHKTFWSFEALYGLLKALNFDKISMWRCKGYHQLRKGIWNERQIEICKALFLDWYGNILALGARGKENVQARTS